LSLEGQLLDKKSLRVLKNNEYRELAKDCVVFANAQGGSLLIGIEDDSDLPPENQKIRSEWLEKLPKRISQLTLNVTTVPQKIAASNGGEYIELKIMRNANSIAGTSDGRYFLRVSDETRPLLPDELSRLMNDKTAFAWEEQTNRQVLKDAFDEKKKNQFLKEIRQSERVSNFVKEMSDEETLKYYYFTKDNFLTNLGILWIGKSEDRAFMQFSPVVQFIKFDELDRKVNKLVWDDFSRNPKELIESILKDIPDWREFYELPDGMFRKQIPHYDERVIRELLANALVHRPYTQRRDIFINLFPDRLEIHNPGLLPLGVTPQNILHTTAKRNEHLAKAFYDLKLMEREGSGYDLIYDQLLSNAKPLPKVEEGNDRVRVTIQKRIINSDIIEFISKADETFQLKQKERITLGLIAQKESLTAIQLSKLLELHDSPELKNWLGRLIDLELIKTKGKEYFVKPKMLRTFNFKGKTTLKGIESHRLQELILRDLEIYKEASFGDIHKRIGKEIPIRKVRYEITKMIEDEKIVKKGKGKGTKYLLTK
jgi:ATP-dependent DNA helicase RecG